MSKMQTDQKRKQTPRPDLSASDEVNLDPGMTGLCHLEQVSLTGRDRFLSVLSRAEKILNDLPIELPANGQYQLSLEGNVLHIHEMTQGISDFQITGGAEKVLKVHQNSDEVSIEFQTSEGVVSLTLHKEPLHQKQSEETSEPIRDSSCGDIVKEIGHDLYVIERRRSPDYAIKKGDWR